MQQLAKHSVNTKPFGSAEQYGEHEQQEAQAVTTVGGIVLTDAGDRTYAGAQGARNRKQDLLPCGLNIKVELRLDLGLAIMGGVPAAFGFAAIIAVGGCCSCHIVTDSTRTGAHGR